MDPQAIDYNALAKQAGAVSSTPPPSADQGAQPVDYTALAKQAGAVSSEPGSQEQVTSTWRPDEDSGGIGQTALNAAKILAHDIWWAPKNIADALTDPHENPLEKLSKFMEAQEPARQHTWQLAKDAYAKGNYKEAFEHAVTSFPIIGPPFNAALNEMRAPLPGQPPDETHQGLPAQGIAHFIENFAPLAAPALGELAETAPAQRALQAVKSRIPEQLTVVPRLVRPTLNPTQQEAVDFLQSQNVPLNAGTVTGNRFVKGAQALVANTPLGSGVAAAATKETEQGLARLSGELAEQAHPEPVTPESAGAAVSSKLDQNIAALKGREDEAYGTAWKGANDPRYAETVPVRTDEDGAVMQSVQMPVDVRDIKTQLEPVLEQMSWMPAADRASSAGYQAVKKILDGPDFIPAPAAEQGLGGLKTMARVANPNLRDTGQGLAAGIIPRLQEAVNDAVAKTGSDALAALQDGRAAHASKMEVADLADQLRDEPVQTFNKLTWRKDTGISFLRKIADQAPDMLPQVGRAYLQNLFDVATQEGGFSRATGIAKQWENLGPETKKLLYPNQQLQSSLDNFFRGAKMAAENPNPSGTALVGQVAKVLDFASGGAAGAGLYMHSPWPLAGAATYHLGTAALAKLLYSPSGVRLLTEGWKPELPVAAASRVAQILKMTGGEDVSPAPPPEEPPEGGPPAGGGPPSGPSAPPAAGGNIAATLQKEADAAIQRMRDRGTFSGTQSNAGFPIEDLADMTIWGAAKLAKGVTQLGPWSKEMLADAGAGADRLKPQLPKLFVMAQKTLERHIANTAGKLPSTQKMLTMYRQGIEGQDWYRNTKAELQSVFGPDTDKFVDFLAATSPNTTVAANTSLALKAYMQWKTGKPFTGYLPETIKSLNKAAAGEEFGGLKVQSFRKNLHGDPVPVTVDRWIARALGFGDQPTVPQYKFMDYLISQVAAKKGLEPRQLQAAIWKTIKDTEGLAGQGGESYEVLVRRKLLSDPDLAAAIQQAAPPRQ